MFAKLYQRIIECSRHRYAPFYLLLLSFVESFILPLTPLLLQVPLIVANRERASRITWYAVIGSFLGGAVGYGIGRYGAHMIIPLLIDGRPYDFDQISQWVRSYGMWAVFLISLSPVPFKITTISSGILGVSFLPFLLLTAVARYLHFFIITFAFLYGNKRIQAYWIRRYGKK